MTNNTNLKDKEIRNIKDRERYKNNEESRNKTICSTQHQEFKYK